MKVVISSGHGKYIRGASGIIDEVDEARRVVETTAAYLEGLGVHVTTYHDNVSKSQDENLERIVDFHNAQGAHDLDVSVHFNAYLNQGQTTNDPKGAEVFYTSSAGMEYADEVVDKICIASGLKNRGPKKPENGLYFLSNTAEVAILIEVCFVDSHADCDIYDAKFDAICNAIANGITGGEIVPGPTPPDENILFQAAGKCSHFGGPEDEGVSPSEGLAFITDYMQCPQLFLPYQPSGTSGLARRLNPAVHYIACRWNYDITPKDMLRSGLMAKVKAPHNGYELLAWPADWGPNQNTGRIADLSPKLMTDLGLTTDDEVEVIFPWEE